MNKVALVTGASSGIGLETALELHKRGFIVYGGARRVDNMKDLKQAGIHVLSLDVTDEASMTSCVDRILKEAGRIDVLVNNAGYGSFGALEDVPLEEAKRQFEVNIFGLARMTQLVLPSMRAHHYGKIVNISSMGGKVTTPFGAWYHGTKFALEGISDCLRTETKPFGIDIIVIEPGGIKTDWGQIAADHLIDSSSKGAYAAFAKKSAEGMKKLYGGKGLTDPKVIAETIGHAITVKRPRTRYLKGYGAKPAVFLKWLLPDRIFDKIMSFVM